MPPTPRPAKPAALVERARTCLETDDDVLHALRANLGTPPPLFAPAAAPRGAALPATAQPPPLASADARASAASYRPTLRPPMAVLTVFDDGKHEGEQIRLRGNRFIVGRTEGDLMIPHDGMISARPSKSRGNRRGASIAG